MRKKAEGEELAEVASVFASPPVRSILTRWLEGYRPCRFIINAMYIDFVCLPP